MHNCTPKKTNFLCYFEGFKIVKSLESLNLDFNIEFHTRVGIKNTLILNFWNVQWISMATTSILVDGSERVNSSPEEPFENLILP